MGGVDVFPYEFSSSYKFADGSPHIETHKLVESECKQYVRGILLKEAALFIDEIIRAKTSGKGLVI